MLGLVPVPQAAHDRRAGGVAAVGRSVHVKVPATTANLGPGFDTLGLALSLYDELTVTVRDEPGATVTVIGVGAGEVPTDETNLVVARRSPTPSSATASSCRASTSSRATRSRTVGAWARRVPRSSPASWRPRDCSRASSRSTRRGCSRSRPTLEGHPDNVAPALFGGLTIAWVTPEGPQYKKLIVHRGVSPLVAVPATTMSTALARSLQPESVPHEDAIFNVSRSALLIAALIQSPELLLAATEDKLHQSYRASAMPETDSLIRMLRSHGLAAVVSGAGPSLLVLGSDPAQRLRRRRADRRARDDAVGVPAAGRRLQGCYSDGAFGRRGGITRAA